MDSYLVKAISLSDINSTTSVVVWSMIIFLIVLLSGLVFALIQQIQIRKAKKTSGPQKLKNKGF